MGCISIAIMPDFYFRISCVLPQKTPVNFLYSKKEKNHEKNWVCQNLSRLFVILCFYTGKT